MLYTKYDCIQVLESLVIIDFLPFRFLFRFGDQHKACLTIEFDQIIPSLNNTEKRRVLDKTEIGENIDNRRFLYQGVLYHIKELEVH